MRPPHLAEIIGTFFLVFAGTGAITINEITHGVIGHAGIALTFGLVVLAMIQTFGDISGAHLNPAVTLGFAVAGRFRWESVPGYLVAQCVGAGTASVLLHCLFPAATNLGTTLPSGPQWQSFVLETVLTAMLMLTILRVADGSKEKGLLAGVAIGAVVGAWGHVRRPHQRGLHESGALAGSSFGEPAAGRFVAVSHRPIVRFRTGGRCG